MKHFSRILSFLISEKKGLTPAYTIDGLEVKWNDKANGYRLPTVEEWAYAAKGGQNFKYAGSSRCDYSSSWDYDKHVKSIFKAWGNPGYGYSRLGFRLVQNK